MHPFDGFGDDDDDDPDKTSNGASDNHPAPFEHDSSTHQPDDLICNPADLDFLTITAVIYDEMIRIAGPEWVNHRVKPKQMSGQRNPAEEYSKLPHNHDCWPPTEENVREFARREMVNTIHQFDAQNQSPHPDYQGDYNPNQQQHDLSASFKQAFQTARGAEQVGQATALWEAGSPANGQVWVCVFAPIVEDGAPQRVDYTTLENIDDEVSVHERLVNLAATANEDYPREPPGDSDYSVGPDPVDTDEDDRDHDD